MTPFLEALFANADDDNKSAWAGDLEAGESALDADESAFDADEPALDADESALNADESALDAAESALITKSDVGESANIDSSLIE